MGKRKRRNASGAAAPAKKRGAWIGAALILASLGGVLGVATHSSPPPAPAPAPAPVAVAAAPMPGFSGVGDGLTTAQRRQAMDLPAAQVLPYSAAMGRPDCRPSTKRHYGTCAQIDSSAPIPLGTLPSDAPLPAVEASRWTQLREAAEQGKTADSSSFAASQAGGLAGDRLTTAQRRALGSQAFAVAKLGSVKADAPSSSSSSSSAPAMEPPASDGLTTEQRRALGPAAFADNDASTTASAQVGVEPTTASAPAQDDGASSESASKSDAEPADGLTVQQRALLGDKAFRKGVDSAARAKMWADAQAVSGAQIASVAQPQPQPQPVQASAIAAPSNESQTAAMDSFDATHGVEAHGVWDNHPEIQSGGGHGSLMILLGLAALALSLAWAVSAWAQKVKGAKDDGLADLALQAGKGLDLDRDGPDFTPTKMD